MIACLIELSSHHLLLHVLIFKPLTRSGAIGRERASPRKPSPAFALHFIAHHLQRSLRSSISILQYLCLFVLSVFRTACLSTLVAVFERRALCLAAPKSWVSTTEATANRERSCAEPIHKVAKRNSFLRNIQVSGYMPYALAVPRALLGLDPARPRIGISSQSARCKGSLPDTCSPRLQLTPFRPCRSVGRTRHRRTV